MDASIRPLHNGWPEMRFLAKVEENENNNRRNIVNISRIIFFVQVIFGEAEYDRP